jgi:hypothetical protein
VLDQQVNHLQAPILAPNSIDDSFTAEACVGILPILQKPASERDVAVYGGDHEGGPAAEEFGIVRIQVEAIFYEDLEDGGRLRGASRMVEVGVQAGGWEAEALREAPSEDFRLVGREGGQSDGFQDRRRRGESRKVGLYEREVTVLGCCHEQLCEVILGSHDEAAGAWPDKRSDISSCDVV